MTEQSISVPDRTSGDGATGARVSTVDSRRGRGSLRPAPPGGPAGAAGAPDAAALSALPEDRFLNRELSWLEFGARLLELASDDRIPLLERVKFLAIFSEGLDEFFQVRVAGLEDQVAAGLRTRSPDGLSPRQQLVAITGRAHELVTRQSTIFSEQVAPGLEAAGMVMSDWHTLDHDDRAHLDDVFNRLIFPILTPLAVDQGHPFPYISDLSLNLVVRVVNPVTGEERIARVKVPPLLSRFVVLPDEERFVPVEQVIAAHLDSIFPSMTIAEHHAFRLTRNADLSVEEDEAGNLLAAVELELHRRRFGQAVRLEASAGIATDLLDMLIAEVDVPEESVYLFDVPIDLGGLRGLTDWERADLQPPPWTPVTPPRLAGGADIFAVLAEHDVLVHHPYESFAASVEAFVSPAAEDPDVLAIKQTLYRTGDDSPIVAALVRASQAGKQVTAVVELQARFDERTNIGWARTLEEAGVQVIYGLVTLKTHSKISLVVRREGDEIRRYCHIGSGNYNSETARLYEDVGLLTADPDIGADVGELFNMLTGSGQAPTFRRLVVSPVSTRSYLLAAIAEEAAAGRSGRIVLKTNGLTDPGDHRRPLPGVAGRSPGGPHRPGPVLPPSRPPRAVGVDRGPLHRGPVPGALADLPLRRCRRPAAAHGHRFRRPDGAQPRPSGRGHRAHRRPGHPATAGRHPRRRPTRRGQLVDPARSTAGGPGWCRGAVPRGSGSACRITAKRRPSNPSGLGAVRRPRPHLRPRRRHRGRAARWAAARPRRRRWTLPWSRDARR